MFITNMEEIATTENRRLALEIICAGIEAVVPENIMLLTVKYYNETRVLEVNSHTYDMGKRVFGGYWRDQHGAKAFICSKGRHARLVLLTSYSDALAVLEKYRCISKVPSGVIDHIKSGIYGKLL